MFARIFKPPKKDVSFQENFIFATSNIVSYEYTKKWCGTGNFTMVLPLDVSVLKKLSVNYIVSYDGDLLFIQNIKYDNGSITLTGTDLNGWLDMRITVFGETQAAGAEGYDVVKGTTGECVNHYINNNIINPEDESRKIPLEIAGTATGITDDSYMARLEMLSSVVINLCNNANIGYEITTRNFSGDSYKFYTLEGVDRSADQNTNPRVILSRKYGSVLDATFEHSVENNFNAIYATGADVTQTVYRDKDNIPSGAERRETSVDVTVDTVADIEQYALYRLQDNIETHTYELSLNAVNGYGTKFFLGDKVTVKDDLTNNMFTAVITEVTKHYSDGEHKITLSLGKQKQKLLNRIINNLCNGNVKKR